MQRSNRSVRSQSRSETPRRKTKKAWQLTMPFASRKTRRTPRGLPPVLVRNDTTQGYVQPRKRSKPRRRYDVSLSVPGAELRLPALPQFALSWRILSALMVIALAAGLFFALTTPDFQVESVMVNGLQRLSENEVNQALDVYGEPVFAVNPAQLTEAIREGFPELTVTSLRVGLPAEIIIEVTERQPVLAWHENGRELWIDEEGVAFPPRGEAGSLVHIQGTRPSPPAIDDQVSDQFLTPIFIEGILKMRESAPEGVPLVYDSEHGLGWLDINGWQVYFGMEVEKIDMKLVVYQALVDRLTQEGLSPELISVEFLHAPYYRLER
jgi:cell division protein FtsQ